MEKTFCGPAVSMCGEVLQPIIARKMLFTAARVREPARTTSIQHNQPGNKLVHWWRTRKHLM